MTSPAHGSSATGCAGELSECEHNHKPRKPLGPMAVHEFEQDPDKTGSACRFCGLDGGNPVHRAGAGTL